MRWRIFPLRPWVKLGLVLGLLGLLAGPHHLGVAPKNSSLASQKIRISQRYGKLPLYFIENKGQVDNRVRFYEKAGGHAIYFTPESIYFALRKKEKNFDARHRKIAGHEPLPGAEGKPTPSAVVQLIPLGMQKGVKIEAVEPQAAKFNYFIGNDPAKWRTNIPSYGAVVYREAYPGVDLKFYGTGRQLEYDIIVKPGGDPNQVKFQYAGIKNLEVTREGDLAIKLPDGGQLIQKKPIVYQEIAGQRLAREGKFRVEKHTARCVYGFEVAAYDKNHPLVIDPVLVFSTYMGGGATDRAYGVDCDNQGHIYVTGATDSQDFPIFPPPVPLQATEAIPPYHGGFDVVVIKLSITASGATLQYTTFLGGSGDDHGYGIAVDSSSNAFITGKTSSGDFATVGNPYQANFGGGASDAFLAKLDSNGSLAYVTYIGGDGEDSGQGIALDDIGRVYLTGCVSSAVFGGQPPEPMLMSSESAGVFSYYAGGKDAFVARLSNEGVFDKALYLGGPGEDIGFGIAVDGYAGNGYYNAQAYVAGMTHGGIPESVRPYGGGDSDAFFAQISFDDAYNSYGLSFFTYLGGSGHDEARAICAFMNSIWVTGFTESSDFPVGSGEYYNEPYQSELGGASDAFVTGFFNNSLEYSSYLGGVGSDKGMGIGFEPVYGPYVAGITDSPDFPIASPFNQPSTRGDTDAFITLWNVYDHPSFTGEDFIFSAILAGTGPDAATAVKGRPGDSDIFVAGYTGSTDFPTEKPLQQYLASGIDAFVAKIDMTTPSHSPPVALASPEHQTVEAGPGCQATVALDGSNSYDPDGDPITYLWSWDGGTATVPNPTITLLGAKEHLITLTVTDSTGKFGTDSVTVKVVDTPVVTLTATPNVLKPSNHQMVPVTLAYTVQMDCSCPFGASPFLVSSNEAVDGLGDGDTSPDWLPESGDLPVIGKEGNTTYYRVNLRAERSGTGTGRVYTISRELFFLNGQSITVSTEVRVPHN